MRKATIAEFADSASRILPWGEDGKTPTFEFCPCCGVEHGYQDATPLGARRYREKWFSTGANWEIERLRPAEWDIQRQLLGVPSAFK
jgi:hypothetical protein